MAPCLIRSTAPCNGRSCPVNITGRPRREHCSKISCGVQLGKLDSLITATTPLSSMADSSSLQSSRLFTRQFSPSSRTVSASRTETSGSIRTNIPFLLSSLIVLSPGVVPVQLFPTRRLRNANGNARTYHQGKYVFLKCPKSIVCKKRMSGFEHGDHPDQYRQ